MRIRASGPSAGSRPAARARRLPRLVAPPALAGTVLAGTVLAGTVLASPALAGTAPSGARPATVRGRSVSTRARLSSTRAVWGLDWRSLYGKQPGWTSATAKRMGIGGVMLDASGLASSYSPAGRALASLRNFDARARRVRCALERRGFRVAAILGAPSWWSSRAWPVLSAMVSEIAYAAPWQACPVRALYLDIEPWGESPSLPHAEALAELAGSLRRVGKTLRASQLPLGVFLPGWAARTAGGPAVLRALRPGDVVAAMTYRSRATGRHGALAANAQFARFVERRGPSLDLLVGFETGPVGQSGVSFHGSTRAQLTLVAHAVGQKLRDVSQFKGFFVNDLASLQRLRA